MNSDKQERVNIEFLRKEVTNLNNNSNYRQKKQFVDKFNKNPNKGNLSLDFDKNNNIIISNNSSLSTNTSKFGKTTCSCCKMKRTNK